MNTSLDPVPASERLRSIDELDAAIVALSRRLNAKTYRAQGHVRPGRGAFCRQMRNALPESVAR